MTNTHITPCPFAELAIHTQCNAFINTDSRAIPYEYVYGKGGCIVQPKVFGGKEYESMPEFPLSARVQLTDKNTIDIQGTFHYTEDSAANLKLICDDFTQRNIEFYVFFAEYYDEETNKSWSEFVIWTPTIPFQINEAA